MRVLLQRQLMSQAIRMSQHRLRNPLTGFAPLSLTVTLSEAIKFLCVSKLKCCNTAIRTSRDLNSQPPMKISGSGHRAWRSYGQLSEVKTRLEYQYKPAP